MSCDTVFQKSEGVRDLANTFPISLTKLFSCARQINANTCAVGRVNLRPHIQLLSAGSYYVLPYVNSKGFTRSAPKKKENWRGSWRWGSHAPSHRRLLSLLPRSSAREWVCCACGEVVTHKKSFLWLKTFCWHPIFSLFRESSRCFILVPASSILTQKIFPLPGIYPCDVFIDTNGLLSILCFHLLAEVSQASPVPFIWAKL